MNLFKYIWVLYLSLNNILFPWSLSCCLFYLNFFNLFTQIFPYFLKSVFFSYIICGYPFLPWQILVEILPFHSLTDRTRCECEWFFFWCVFMFYCFHSGSLMHIGMCSNLPFLFGKSDISSLIFIPPQFSNTNIKFLP